MGINGLKINNSRSIKSTIRSLSYPIRIVFTSSAPARSSVPSSEEIPEGPTSRFCGVSFRKSDRKWLAQIAHNGSKRNIGAYDDEEQAAKAWDKKAMELRGIMTDIN